jgi:hypothetical protein
MTYIYGMVKLPYSSRWLRLAVMIAVAACFLLAAEGARACPNCTEGLAQNDPQGQSIAAGYYYSILFMMSMPFIILTTFGSFAYRSVKRAEVRRRAQQNDELKSGLSDDGAER